MPARLRARRTRAPASVALRAIRTARLRGREPWVRTRRTSPSNSKTRRMCRGCPETRAARPLSAEGRWRPTRPENPGPNRPSDQSIPRRAHTLCPPFVCRPGRRFGCAIATNGWPIRFYLQASQMIENTLAITSFFYLLIGLVIELRGPRRERNHCVWLALTRLPQLWAHIFASTDIEASDDPIAYMSPSGTVKCIPADHYCYVGSIDLRHRSAEPKKESSHAARDHPR